MPTTKPPTDASVYRLWNQSSRAQERLTKLVQDMPNQPSPAYVSRVLKVSADASRLVREFVHAAARSKGRWSKGPPFTAAAARRIIAKYSRGSR